MARTLHALWRRTVEADPGAVALIDASTDRTWTRGELAEIGREWAAAHAKAVAGRRVIFAEANGPEWLRVFLGLLAADATAVALDPSEPCAAQRMLAAEADAAFLWSEGKLEAMQARRGSSRGGACLLKITSGSTGTPRALPFTDAQMAADSRQVCRTMGIRPADLNLGCIPFGHSYGLGNLVLPLLLQGTAVVSGASVLPQALAGAIQRWRPTVFPAVPALLRGLAEAEIDPRQLKSLRTVISAGAPLAPEIAQGFRRKFGLGIHNFYGSSETGGIAYDRSGKAALTGRSVGRPIEGVTLAFGPGGRFTVRSAAVGGKGRFRPADRGVLNPNGELVLLGRTGRMLKIAGRRLDPAEIECALRSLPGVQDALIAPHPDRADSLAAAVATTLSVTELRERLRVRLAPWKVPRKFVTMESFPVSPRGKVDARKIREMLGQPAAPRRSRDTDR
ncbi:MAG: hypothetical protein JWM88_911 [Verrucomicrobia bacterium]|nr:hypothetical protein [Verrucomicrobiota bacterium]